MSVARDIRESAIYRQVAAFYEQIHAPGTERVTDATDITVNADGSVAAFTGSIYQTLQSPPVTRICMVELHSGRLRVLEAASGNDRMPRWSPDGARLAFLSDRLEGGNYQLYLIDGRGETQPVATAAVDGTVEYFHWSPDGSRVLLGIAGFGADFAGCQGGHKTVTRAQELPPWTPLIDTGREQNLWRRLFVFDTASDTVRCISSIGTNFWEACWLGNDRVAAVTSESPGEASWYEARIQSLEVSSGALRVLYVSKDQLGYLAATPSGSRLAFIEAVCSDRLIMAGRLWVLSERIQGMNLCDTRAVDVTYVAWRDERRLMYTGIRSHETVIGEIDVGATEAHEIWSSREKTLGVWNPVCEPVASGGAVGVCEAYDSPPAIAYFHHGEERTVLSLAAPGTRAEGFNRASIDPFTWSARDGLEMQGWLIRPRGPGPFPLVMDIHGGPVWCCRNRWQGRLRGAKVLADHGIASFYPNPRGSTGRGVEFARRVKGDMGGEDTYDCLTGLDALVAVGVADPKCLGVTGASYGGFMSCWLITQDARFAAAAPVSCVSDWYSTYLTSQVAGMCRVFLNADPETPQGRMYERSPVMFARNVRTPTLQLTGAQDQNTPPTQALEFHRALLMQGRVPTVLVTYPTAGHGIRTFPEVIDATARYVGWMLHYLTPCPARADQGR